MEEVKSDSKNGCPGEEAPRRRLLDKLAGAKNFRSLFPESVRRFGRRFLPLEDYARRVAGVEDQNANAEVVSTYPAKVDIRLGIIKEFLHLHTPYIDVCRDLGVPYRLIDISGPDWIDVVRDSQCDAFLVRPSAYMTVWKQMYDERLKVMVEDMGKIIYPTYNEMWFYESKRRMHYWLEANEIPYPRTWVFYDKTDALDFAGGVGLPIVYKADLGSSASGVKILHNRQDLVRLVRKCFKRGLVRKDGDPRDRQWGSVFFQEYLPDVAEWRIIRLGKGYYGHQKLKEGQFHSGSGKAIWRDPPKKLLDMAREIADVGSFTSMNLDIFETTDGKYLVNELQSLFGSHAPYQMLVNGKAGRYVYDYDCKSWHFEEGIFCQNASYRPRVIALLEKLGQQVELPKIRIVSLIDEDDRQGSIRVYNHQASRRPE